ncbi:MAG: hypothetical protein K5697_12065 [Lachnospiraceae bacterium]|nr:hypothetical protein [Lachnospiraceae bacterium]
MIGSKAEIKITGDEYAGFYSCGLTMHRILSFWSAEGRVKTDDLTELNMEHSWNHMAYRVEKFGNVGCRHIYDTHLTFSRNPL